MQKYTPTFSIFWERYTVVATCRNSSYKSSFYFFIQKNTQRAI